MSLNESSLSAISKQTTNCHLNLPTDNIAGMSSLNDCSLSAISQTESTGGAPPVKPTQEEIEMKHMSITTGDTTLQAAPCSSHKNKQQIMEEYYVNDTPRRLNTSTTKLPPSSSKTATPGRFLNHNQNQQHHHQQDVKNSYEKDTELPPLHHALLTQSTIAELRAIFHSLPAASTVKDNRGRLPLHLLSQNRFLLQHTFDDRDSDEERRAFVKELFLANPLAAVTADNDGCIPFSYALHAWIARECVSNVDGDDEDDEMSKGKKDNILSSWRGGSLENDNANRPTTNEVTTGDMNTSYNSVVSSLVNSFFKRSDGGANGIPHHGVDGNYDDAPSIGPSVAPSTVTPSLAASACPSTWSYRYERRPDVRLAQHQRQQSHQGLITSRRDDDNDGDTSSAASISPRSLGGGNDVPTAGNNASLMSAYPSVMKEWTRHCTDDTRTMRGDGELGMDASVVIPPPHPTPEAGYATTNDMVAANDSFAFPSLADGNEDGIIVPDDALTSLQLLDMCYSLFHNMTSREARKFLPDKMTHPETGDSKWLAKVLVSALSATPNLPKLLHFSSGDGDDKSDEITELSIVSKILTSPYAIGNWMVYMLESPQWEEKGVKYLESFRENDNQEFERIEYLDYILPSVLALSSTRLVHHAARTPVWTYIIAENLRGDELLPWIICDFVARVLLIVGFHAYALQFLAGSVKTIHSIIYYNMGMASVLYLGLRQLNYYATVFKITSFSTKYFRFAGHFWDVLGLSSLISGFGMLTWMHIYVAEDNYNMPHVEKLLVTATVLIWTDLLGWWRLVNCDVAFYLGALFKVLKDTVYYILIVAITILSFSQMLQILQHSSHCEKDAECLNPYLQTYSTFLLSFDVAEYTTNPGTLSLFLIFTSITVFFLLTTLLSIINHSYHRAVTSLPVVDTDQTSRLVYLAHTKTSHILVTSPWTLMQYCAATLFAATVGVLAILTVEEKRISMMNYYGFMVFFIGLGVILLFMLVSVLAFLSHLTFYDYGSAARKMNRPSWCCVKISRGLAWMFAPVRWLARSVLLSSRHGTTPNGTNVDNLSSGHVESQLTYPQRAMVKKFDKKVVDLERRVITSNADLRAEILNEMKASQSRMEEMIVQLLLAQMRHGDNEVQGDMGHDVGRRGGSDEEDAIASDDVKGGTPELLKQRWESSYSSAQKGSSGASPRLDDYEKDVMNILETKKEVMMMEF